MNIDLEHYKRHWREHWKMTIIGSSIGFSTTIANLFYQYLTGQLPSLIEPEILEIFLFAIPILIFMWFLRVAVWEYEELKSEMKMKAHNDI